MTAIVGTKADHDGQGREQLLLANSGHRQKEPFELSED